MVSCKIGFPPASSDIRFGVVLSIFTGRLLGHLIRSALKLLDGIPRNYCFQMLFIKYFQPALLSSVMVFMVLLLGTCSLQDSSVQLYSLLHSTREGA